MKAETVQAAVKEDMMMGTLDSLATEVTLAAVAKEWYLWNQYKMLPDKKDKKGSNKGGKGGGQQPKGQSGGQDGPPRNEFMAQIVNYINF